ncbi:hypothetical protein [Brachybacterium sp. YJGR34]|uniref:hypothetical protein n=1 Tax=Brachybacterium sp. YJGR34 TaxID=2059911 RepID=UPI000E0AA78D|nr:hypothetical protein [Brachybacterium sp. YJGR34]
MSDLSRSGADRRGRSARPAARPHRAARSLAARALAALGVGVLALTPTACDRLPGVDPGGTSQPAARGEPMDPEEVAAAATTPVDPGWLCHPGEDEPPLRSAEGGTLIPETVRAEGNDLQVSGPFRLEEGYDYAGFTPVGVMLPAAPEDRGSPLEGYDGELGVEGAPVPPMVVRERVESGGQSPAPSAATAQLTLGTCDDAPLPDGQYLLRLTGGELDGPGRGEDDAGWSASGDVLVDVVGGALEPVPGAVTAPGGEIPADLGPLACGAELRAVGDGDGLAITASDAAQSVSTTPPEDGAGGVTAEVTVTSEDLGTRALLPGVVLTDPATGTIVAGARNSPEIPLQWLGEDGMTRAETAWTTQGACHTPALSPGTYRAHAVAATVDAEGTTHVVVSDPWDVEVLEDEPVY